jgi:hypothetical protein
MHANLASVDVCGSRFLIGYFHSRQVTGIDGGNSLQASRDTTIDMGLQCKFGTLFMFAVCARVLSPKRF